MKRILGGFGDYSASFRAEPKAKAAPPPPPGLPPPGLPLPRPIAPPPHPQPVGDSRSLNHLLPVPKASFLPDRMSDSDDDMALYPVPPRKKRRKFRSDSPAVDWSTLFGTPDLRPRKRTHSPLDFSKRPRTPSSPILPEYGFGFTAPTIRSRDYENVTDADILSMTEDDIAARDSDGSLRNYFDVIQMSNASRGHRLARPYKPHKDGPFLQRSRKKRTRKRTKRTRSRKRRKHRSRK